MAEDTYEKLIDLLEQHCSQYRLIDHPPEGRTEVVSPMRGNNLRDAAKCMILMIKLGKKTAKYGDTPSFYNVIRCCHLGFAMSGRNRRVLLEEPAAGNLHGGVCEGGDIPVVPWWT